MYLKRLKEFTVEKLENGEYRLNEENFKSLYDALSDYFADADIYDSTEIIGNLLMGEDAKEVDFEDKQDIIELLAAEGRFVLLDTGFVDENIEIGIVRVGFDDDKNYVVGVVSVDGENYPFDYNIEEEMLDIHHYSEAGWMTGASYEKMLPDVIKRNWEKIDCEIMSAVDGFLGKENETLENTKTEYAIVFENVEEEFFTEDENEYQAYFEQLKSAGRLNEVHQCFSKGYILDIDTGEWEEDWCDILWTRDELEVEVADVTPTFSPKYNKIIKCDLEGGFSNLDYYENCYLLTGDNIEHDGGLEVELTGEFFFNTEFKSLNRQEVAKINTFDELVVFCKEHDIYVPDDCLKRKDCLCVGGERDYVLNNNLAVLGWVEDLQENLTGSSVDNVLKDAQSASNIYNGNIKGEKEKPIEREI